MRIIYWTMASFYMFIATGVLVSILKPGPTENQVMQWMQGMMAAMHSSLMGASMESSEAFRYLFWQSGRLSLLMLLLALIVGIPAKIWRKHD